MDDKNLEKKNDADDDKEIINFMKFVDDKCLQINSVENSVDKEANNYVLEQKPLNDKTCLKKDDISITNASTELDMVDRSSYENNKFLIDNKSNLNKKNKELNNNTHVNENNTIKNQDNNLLSNNIIIENEVNLNTLKNKKSICFLQSTEKLKNNELINYDLQFENEKLNILKNSSNPFETSGNFSKSDKLKIDFNDQMTSHSTRLNLQMLNKQIKKMAQVESKKIILRNDQLEVKSKLFNDEVRISKFPGYLFINIYAIERYFGTDVDVKSIFVRMQTANFTFDTCDLKESSLIKINNLVYLNLTNSNSFDITFYLIKKINDEIIKKCELTVNINKNFLSRIHNNLIDVKYEWTPYCSKNIFKKFKKFFSSSLVDAHKLQLFFSFISVEEFKIINVPIPMTLMNLCRWIKIRKYSYSNWFSGFCNIKGTIPNICTHLWKRRYIKLYGYRIYIFNEFTKILVGTYEIFNEKKITENNNKIIFGHEKAKLELLFDNNDKYQMFRSVLEILL